MKRWCLHGHLEQTPRSARQGMILRASIGVVAILATVSAGIGGAPLSIAEWGGEFIPANVISDTDQHGNVDGRGTLTEKAAELGLSDAEVERIRGTTGFVVCPGKTHDNGGVSTGALVGSNRQIITVAHAFIDKLGREREPLSDCYFLTQATRPQKIFFDFAPGHFFFGTELKRELGDPNDFAVVALKDPIEGVAALEIDETEVGRGEWVTAVAAAQESPSRTFPGDEPVVQKCRVRATLGRIVAGESTLQYVTDCDFSPLGSGGVLLTRDAAGDLQVRGVMATTGKPKLNGQPYDPATGSFTAAVSTRGRFARFIAEVKQALKAPQ